MTTGLTTFPVPVIQEGVWEDVAFPVTAINPAGAASPPSVDNTDGCFLFASGADNVFAVVAQMPHGWVEGTPIYPHVHWEKTTSAARTVLWQMKQRTSAAAEVAPAFSVFADSVTPLKVSDANTAERHAISHWGALDMTGKTISTIVRFVVQRHSAGGADTYAANAKLMSFDCHVLMNSRGSRQEYIK